MTYVRSTDERRSVDSGPKFRPMHPPTHLAHVAVQLPREAESARGAAHGQGHEVVQFAIGRRRELERAEADVVERLCGQGSNNRAWRGE